MSKIYINKPGSTLAKIFFVIATIFASNVFAEEYELFVSFANSNNIEKYIIKKGFKFLPIIYQRNIDADNDGKLDHENYLEHIKNTLSEYEGPIVIDWEGSAYQKLIGNATEDGKIRDIDIHFAMSAILLKKEISKPIKVGYYGLPSKKSTRSNSTAKETEALKNIYTNTEILYPSLYLNNNQLLEKQSIRFAEKHLLNTLKVVCGQKKVYAFITHRWHPRSRFNPNSLIPIAVFENYIESIRNVNYRGRYVDGIIWWGADEHWYNKKKKEIRRSLNQYDSVHEYNKEVIDNYANIILKYFRPKIKRKRLQAPHHMR